MPDDFIRTIHANALESPLGATHITQSMGKPYSTLLQEINPHDLGAEAFTEAVQMSNNNVTLHSVSGQVGSLLEHND